MSIKRLRDSVRDAREQGAQNGALLHMPIELLEGALEDMEEARDERDRMREHLQRIGELESYDALPKAQP